MTLITAKIRPFDPKLTFTSGQCFRWVFEGEVWKGIADGRYAEITGSYPDVKIKCERNDLLFWETYFDSDYDYEASSKKLEKDSKISEAIKKHKGLILLRQPFFETLISFIISANNNIKRITRIIDNISVKYGTECEFGYTFPSPQSLAGLECVDLMQQNCGYRSDYIIETSKMYLEGFDYKYLETSNLSFARDKLCEFKGVGKKVADCILIYSLGRKDAYPVDTWIRKASWDYFGKKMSDDEIRKSAKTRFGSDAALAQQYMFVSEREKQN